MWYYVRTTFGDSCQFYDSGTDIFQGLCQGNGASPALWILISSFLFHYLKGKGCGLRVSSTISREALAYVALVYVDNGHLPTIAAQNNESIRKVVESHQYKGLTTSCGSLMSSKYFLVPHTMDMKRWYSPHCSCKQSAP